MDNERALIKFSIVATLMASICTLIHADGPFFEYESFRSLTSLVPEVKKPRPVGGSTEAAFQLWAQGQLRLTNPDQYRVEADFDGNGKIDVALPFKSEKGFHLSIAERSGDYWQRKALIHLSQESAVS